MVLRRIARVGIRSGVAWNVGNAWMIGYSYWGTDTVQRDRIAEAASYSMSVQPTISARGWLSRTFGWLWPGNWFSASPTPIAQHHERLLPADERRCVDAMTDLLRFNMTAANTTNFAPNIVLNDALICFDGLSEMKDGWKFLSCFFDECEPQPVAIKRDVDVDGGIVLHVDYETQAVTRFGLFRYTFQSQASLVLQPSPGPGKADKNRLRVSVIEHRWFRGPVLSRMTSTLENPLGDIGDLMRRANGFGLSLVLTATH